MKSKISRIVAASFLSMGLLGSANAIPVVFEISQAAQGGFGAQSAASGSLSQLSPFAVNYSINTDFKFFVDDAVLGSVSGQVQVIGGDGGCSAADFAGFTAGNIALLTNTFCLFSTQINLAAAAGAIGAMVQPVFFDSGTNYGLGDPAQIVSLMISNTLADEIIRIDSIPTAVPEPGTLSLLGGSLLAFAIIMITGVTMQLPANIQLPR